MTSREALDPACLPACLHARSSYNAVNGVPSCANKWLLNTIAREEWNGKASPIYVTSDCTADLDVFDPHNYTKSAAAAVADIIMAGQDINCGGFMAAHIDEAIKAGLASTEDVDAALRRSLGVRARLGHFDPPGPLQSVEMTALCDPEAIELARDGAAQGGACPGRPATCLLLAGTACPGPGRWRQRPSPASASSRLHRIGRSVPCLLP